RAVAARPDDVDTAVYLWRALVKRGLDARASQLYAQVSARLHNPIALRRAKARIDGETGAVDDAERELLALLRDDPGDPETRATLRKRVAQEALGKAQTSHDDKDLRIALERFDKAAELLGGDPEVHIGAGDTLVALTRFHEARLRYRKAREVPTGKEWMTNL